MDSNDQPKGTDSRVEDWFGQSVERDAELADELSEELGEDEAEQRFEEQATGEAEQASRHGDQIDPDQGRSAYATDSDREESAPKDADSPGATIDDPEPAEPNEPG